jgi:hypothetical protein
MVSRDRVRALRREAAREGVVVHLNDGTTKYFSWMHVQAELYLARLDATSGREGRSSDVLDAMATAAPESRQLLEDMAAGADNGVGDLEPLDAEVEEELEDLSEGGTDD